MRFSFSAVLLVPSLALLGACATVDDPAPAATGPETYIPYAARDGIVEWRLAGDNGIYARALTGGWYLVRTVGPCPGLRARTAVGFEPSFGGKLDRGSAIVAEGQRCPIDSVTRIEGKPPRRARR